MGAMQALSRDRAKPGSLSQILNGGMIDTELPAGVGGWGE
jgi:hypothetical protein